MTHLAGASLECSCAQLSDDQVRAVKETLAAVLEAIEYMQTEALRCATSVAGDRRDHPGTEAQRVVIAEMWGWEMGAGFVLGRIEELLGDVVGLLAPGTGWQRAAPGFVVDAWTEVYEVDRLTPSPD